MKTLVLGLTLLGSSIAHADSVGILDCGNASAGVSVTLEWYPFGQSTPARGIQGEISQSVAGNSNPVINSYASINRKTVGTTRICVGPGFNLSLLNVSPTRCSGAVQKEVVGYVTAKDSNGMPINDSGSMYTLRREKLNSVRNLA